MKLAVFGGLYRTHGLEREGKKCEGGKRSKQRFTMAFMVSAPGMKEKPIVIWKSEKPRCFRVFDIDALPVKCYMPSAQFVDVW